MPALFEKALFKCKYLYKHLFSAPEKIYIYSYGGSGTRTFYEFVKRFKKVNGQSNVHWDLVKSIKPNERVIYLYSNPINAIKSFYRKDAEDGKFISEHCRNLGVVRLPPKTLEEYAKNGRDDFNLYKHFQKFVLNNNSYEIMIIHFDEIWENLDKVLKYMGIDKKHKVLFPKKKVRKGEQIDIGEEVEESLETIYQDMNAEFVKTPSVYIKKITR